MSSIVIEYPIPEGQSIGDAYDAARELIAVEAAKHPDAEFGDPVWEDRSNLLIATVHYNGELTPDEPVEEPVEEKDPTLWDKIKESFTTTPETCSTVKTDGDVCGRKLPCQYHK